ncbi:hypothetical protein RZS08_03560, partial [Arthrospira platensis SPKY1]|nr:hypothetical protein [Arthrospira platensis SPKY1]
MAFTRRGRPAQRTSGEIRHGRRVTAEAADPEGQQGDDALAEPHDDAAVHDAAPRLRELTHQHDDPDEHHEEDPADDALAPLRVEEA